MDLNEMRARYEREEGYSRLNATARVCQDVILSKLAASSMRDRVTVKGGVLMCALSGSSRRATQDIDLDFVRYPMTDASIRSFVSALSNLDDGITIRIVTDYDLGSSSLPFTKTEEGYLYTKNSLPMGELTFSIARDASSGSQVPYDGEDSPVLLTALILLGVVVVCAAGVAVAAIVVHRRTKKLQARRQERLARGRPQEGTIDLPSSEEEKGKDAQSEGGAQSADPAKDKPGDPPGDKTQKNG